MGVFERERIIDDIAKDKQKQMKRTIKINEYHFSLMRNKREEKKMVMGLDENGG